MRTADVNYMTSSLKCIWIIWYVSAPKELVAASCTGFPNSF